MVEVVASGSYQAQGVGSQDEVGRGFGVSRMHRRAAAERRGFRLRAG
jgi:hypothetical protein